MRGARRSGGISGGWLTRKKTARGVTGNAGVRQHFSVPSTFFFVISYVEVLNWCLTLATYENAWG
jgi:hypothetical protein